MPAFASARTGPWCFSSKPPDWIGAGSSQWTRGVQHTEREHEGCVVSPLPHVLYDTRSLGRLGKHVHFHLHDGHPLVPGLRDHLSFLTRLAIPFSYQGRRSLNMMYGPGGLASIVSTAIDACPPRGASFTVEVHQVEGRLPRSDAAWLFAHWQDTTNAERMNYWLSVLSENAMLTANSIPPVPHSQTSALSRPGPSSPPP